jgi:uncharacterized RDD family membrane protein YckC
MTTERVAVAPPPAGLWVRTPAFLCDQLVVTAAVVVPALVGGVPVAELTAPGQPRTAAFLAAMGVAFLYHTLAEWLRGRTLGKQLFNLAVVTDAGTAIGLKTAVVRNALRLIDGLGYWSVAVVVILIRGDGKRLGDAAAGTVVVRQ